ncbi:MAG TPA: general stress protein CsbD [Ferruginibacter sp.]|nr:general stress protein CsbD [Ferruginibacter sp.]
MNKLKLNQPWDEVKERLKEINGSLTDEDLVYEEGKEDVLLAHLSSKINMSTDDVKGLIESVSFNEGKAS